MELASEHRERREGRRRRGVRVIAGNAVCRLGERNGWVHESHHIDGKPGSVIRLSIPIQGNKLLKAGLLHRL
jgi:hypothetical protein